MAKMKKDGKRINFYLKTSVVELLDLYCAKVGQTKTEAVERILAHYLQHYIEQAKEKELREDTGNWDAY
ncbi:MAG: hypothetical protein IJ056_02590 [Acidaminococcaceae bacterium]|nr:hypothetical protein [Acidaminococcaceae bacterium]